MGTAICNTKEVMSVSKFTFGPMHGFTGRFLCLCECEHSGGIRSAAPVEVEIL